MPFKNELLAVVLIPTSLLFILVTLIGSGRIDSQSACLCYPWLMLYLPGALGIPSLANPILLYFYFQDALSPRGRMGLLAWEIVVYFLALVEFGDNLSTPNPDPWASVIVILLPILSTLMLGHGLTRLRIGNAPPKSPDANTPRHNNPYVTMVLASVVGIPGLWGLGQIYAGMTGRGVRLFTLGVVFVNIFLGSRYAPLALGVFGITVVLWIWQVGDAYRIAMKPRVAVKEAELRQVL